MPNICLLNTVNMGGLSRGAEHLHVDVWKEQTEGETLFYEVKPVWAPGTLLRDQLFAAT